MTKTEAARTAAEDAKAAWNKAPLHIKRAAGEWVAPILAAIDAQQVAAEDHEGRLAKLEGADRGE